MLYDVLEANQQIKKSKKIFKKRHKKNIIKKTRRQISKSQKCKKKSKNLRNVKKKILLIKKNPEKTI